MVNGTAVGSENSSSFKKSLLKRIKKLIMINDEIRNEKLQHDIDKEAAKTLALSSGKIDKYDYLNSKEILPSIKV